MIDRINIVVKAGDGGDGIVSFRREKFAPNGGPDGGDGGNGGNVLIQTSESISSLRGFKKGRSYRAGDGGDGGSNRKHGKGGEDLVLLVPAGTVVSYLMEDGGINLAADLRQAGEEMVAARGGRGGRGNTHYTSSTNQSPRVSQQGEPGEECAVCLEMRLIADVGIIGLPNAGKSTLLASASAARPKIDSYPFTTLEPVLGRVASGLGFTLAEIPGLITGAHLGRGLGHDFLRHALRTKVLIHLVSGSSASPAEDMMRVNEELNLYDPSLARKPQIVALNKIDLPEVQARLEGLTGDFNRAGIQVIPVSAATGQGVPGLMAEAARILASAAAGEGAGVPRRVFRPLPRDAGVTISKAGGVYVLSAPELERLVAGTGASEAELRRQLQRQLDRLGVKKALEKAGAKPGDKVRCGNLEWEW
jgi:GTP-binding protein